jgi:uncharacterized protein (DUF1800 family)
MSTTLAVADPVPAQDLTRRAAVHILNRLGYGARPGDVDRVLSMGLDRYIARQLDPGPDAALDGRLEAFPYLGWTMAETYSRYLEDQQNRGTNYIATLNNQQRSAQIVRAVHAQNQLHEVMTWFWMNHFSVNLPDDYVRYSIHDYEKALRTHALGRFKDLLSASAHHPAMMSYLDNYLSTVSRFDRNGRLTSGLNENYGRELLELHTVGVDAGYSQNHVYNAATVLTGWGLNRAQGAFVFTAANHDPQATEVFGLNVPAGQMQESGEKLLEHLAAHPKTAEFIATKLVRHFVTDDPPAALVQKVADTFLKSGGDVREMLRVIVASKEFWDQAFGPGKYKDPFQYVASTLRAVDADVQDARALAAVLNNMGQPQYGCIPPTGWSDKGREWVNPSSHMYRMNFALDLVSNVVGGNNAQPFTGIFVDIPKILGANGVRVDDGAAIAAFFNREIFGNALSAGTLGAAGTATNGTVALGNRVVGLLLAGPEAQGR